MKKFLVVLFFLIIFGCSHKANKVDAKNEINEIDQFWEKFNDPSLNQVVKEALISNADVLTAMINVNKAQMNLGISSANRLPTINIHGSAVKQRDSDNLYIAPIHETYNIFNLGVVFNYQIDIWGKMAAANKAAKNQLAALESTKKAVKITIASEVTKGYFNLISLDNKINLLNQVYELNKKLYQLKLKQGEIGQASEEEIYNYQVMMNKAYMQLIEMKQELFAQEKALAVLIGKDVAESIISRTSNIASITDPKLKEEISSKMLLKRPDIIAAEKILEASKYNIKVARASYFPEISIASAFGYNSNHSSNLFEKKSQDQSIAGKLNFQTFDFGKKGSILGIAKADKSQAEVDYQLTIRKAFAEGLTALEAKKNNALSYKQAQEYERALSKKYNLANKQYKTGRINLFELVEARKNWLLAECELINSSLGKLTSSVSLFEAFGGNID